MFIQNVKFLEDSGRQHDEHPEGKQIDNTLYNELLQRFFKSLQFTKKLGVLRYNSVWLSTL